MNKIHNKRSAYKSRITRRILLQYLLSLAVFIAGFFLLAILAYNFVSQFAQYIKDPLYSFLKLVRDNRLVFVGIPLIAGWTLITYFFMGRPLRYLDEIISASKKLANPTDEQIILSDAMKGVQDELNQVRETALHNAQLAKEAEQRKNDLIMYLAHDLKTPLSSVIGYLTLLRDEGQISPELREKYLSIAHDKAERLEDLINEFFEITRFNLSQITLQYSKISLARLLEQLVFEFQPILKEKNLTCKLQTPENLMLRCDADKIQRVFENLLRNAVIYSFPDTEINITSEWSEESVVICFLNHGSTIPKEKLSRIFEQFYRLDDARSSGGGAGLGLAIAKQIITLHNGTISAESADETIKFTVTLPLS